MGTFKRAHGVRNDIYRCILDSTYDCDDMSDAERAAHIWQRFNAEYNYPENKRRIPNLQARVAEWLSGVALNIPIYNSDIIDTVERWHETTLTDKQATRVIENWFSFMAFRLMQCVRHYGVNINGSY